MRLGELAARLDRAEQAANPIRQLSAGAGLNLDDAYQIQQALVLRRMARGERCVGAKLGFTSRAKAAQMGVSGVIAGRLTSGMRVPDGGTVPLGRFIHPRIEPEIAFRLGHEVDLGAEPADLERAVNAVAPALEIIDSRYRDFRFDLADVIADNTSAAGFAIGPWQPVGERGGDLGNRGVVLEADGFVVQTGSTAAILGHPVRALHALAVLAARYRLALPAGAVVLAGAATAAIPLTGVAAVEAHVAGLGRVALRMQDGRRD
jgi:2-oxo-3-hexenedioate decarboxylase